METAIFSGNDSFLGKAGDDVLLGFAGNDVFNLTKGGNDTASGGDGNDTFQLRRGLSHSGQRRHGGTGSDKVTLSGDYSAGVTFGASTMVNVETLVLGAGNNYDLVLNAASDTSGQSLNVTAGALDKLNSAIIDASALTGTLRLAGGLGNDTLYGGSGSNTILGGGGDDTIFAGTGDNAISDSSGGALVTFSNWTSGDSVKGPTTGTRSVSMAFDGDLSAGVTVTSAQIQGVLGMSFAAGHDYNLTFTGGFALNDFNGGALGAGDHLILDFSGASELTGEFSITGGAGDDTITLGAHTQATFNMTEGGNDTVTGGPGPDTFNFGNSFTAADSVNGGGGADILGISGSTTIVLGARTITNISTFHIGGTSSGTGITTTHHHHQRRQCRRRAHDDRRDRRGQSADTVTFDGSAETDGSFSFVLQNAQVEDILTGGAGDDTFTASGADGENGPLNSASQFDGGAGNDTLSLIEMGSVTFGANALTSIETLVVSGDHGTVTMNNGNVQAGQTLNVELTGMGFNGLKETDGSFDITGTGAAYGGQGNDTITLSSNSSGHVAHFQGAGGADHLTFTGTNSGTAQSSSTARRPIPRARATTPSPTSTPATASSVLHFAVQTAVDASVTSGALSTASFDTDLAAAVGASQLGAHHAVVFTASSGTLAGDHFLVIDANGTAGYQAGQDFVILLDTAGQHYPDHFGLHHIDFRWQTQEPVRRPIAGERKTCKPN